MSILWQIGLAWRILNRIRWLDGSDVRGFAMHYDGWRIAIDQLPHSEAELNNGGH